MAVFAKVKSVFTGSCSRSLSVTFIYLNYSFGLNIFFVTDDVVVIIVAQSLINHKVHF